VLKHVVDLEVRDEWPAAFNPERCNKVWNVTIFVAIDTARTACYVQLL
jgi:hypothetical protein